MSYLNSICHQDWAITPAGAIAARKRFDKMESITMPKSIQQRPIEDWWGQPIEQPRTANGVAIIPIKGVLIKAAEPIFKMFGFISHDDVMTDLKSAYSQGVRAIALDIDSPGGTVVGTRELADLVWQICNGDKPVLLAAHTERLMASAALYAAAGASFINAAPSSIVGSVGTVMTHLDASRYYADMGIDFQQFASGKYKGMLDEGVPLTQDQKDFLQNNTLQLAEEFKAHMRTCRAMAEDDMQGQWFTGEQAQQKAIVDTNFHTLNDLLKQFGGA